MMGGALRVGSISALMHERSIIWSVPAKAANTIDAEPLLPIPYPTLQTQIMLTVMGSVERTAA